MPDVTSGEVLKEALNQAETNVIKFCEKHSYSKNTLYPKTQDKRQVPWNELNELTKKICGKNAYTLAMEIQIRREVLRQRETEHS
jgi:hypothetical protein